MATHSFSAVGGNMRLGRSRSRNLVHARRVGRRLQCQALSTAIVKFRIHQHVSFGESMRLVGGHTSLGNWNPDNGYKMTWNDGDVWTAEVELPSNEQLEFKCVKAGGSFDWEGGNNRSIQVAAAGTIQDIACEWGETDSTHIIIHQPSTAVDGSSAVANVVARTMSNSSEVQRQPAPSVPGSQEELLQATADRLPTQEWAGREIVFMRANNHTRERQGQWDTEGLQGAVLRVVEGDSNAPNWLRKLDVAKRVLVDENFEMKPREDELAAAYVYLHWISTGSIPCVEGGSHHRPNHHAEIGRLIFRSLEWVVGETDADDPVGCRRRSLIARRLHTKIPSFSDAFLVSVPMTRIRDIAHRNDIPHELKQEIKHTLQNKLHRCAGPEDLVATEAMLARITAKPGQYPEAFVREFRIFTAELQEFFNAGGLRELLQTIIPSLEEGGVAIINTFLAAKAKVDTAGTSPTFNDLMEALHTLTTVRALVASGLSSGLRNDAPDRALSMRQRWRLAEIRCEDYAFVLISRMINLLDGKGGPAALAKSADRDWALPIGATVLGVRHMGLSNWETKECMALEHELAAWQKAGGFQDRENSLRLKATLDRVQRLAESYSDTILDVFAERATQIGRSIGVPDHAVKVFAESEIRASVVFQLSRLVSLLQKASRVTSGAAEWDALVAGTVQGKLVEMEHLDPAALEKLNEPVVLLLKSADGDEELAAAGPNLMGVVLCHELPHLSHLGVRARQEQVVFACCEDESYMREKIKPLVGQQVVLAATAEGVSLSRAASQAPAAPAGSGRTAVQQLATNGVGPSKNGKRPDAAALAAMVAGPVNRVSQVVVFAMMDSTPANCGAKAAGCARLEQVALQANSIFRTPRGCSIPFGCMEAAIKALKKDREFNGLLKAVEAASTEELEPLCNQLQELVSAVRPPKKMLQEVRKQFAADTMLMVRSSSNVEDLAGMSGAGLYESIPQVKAWDDEDLGAAVAEVWASLYTRRAVLARRAAGVQQQDAVMAVLVQEQLVPDFSFVLHTASPLDRNPAVLYAELAVGMGETLASGTRGSPYRLLVNKATGEVLTLAFANFSEALASRVDRDVVAPVAGGRSSSRASSRGGTTAVAEAAPAATEMGMWVVDYSSVDLSLDPDRRAAVGRRLAEVGVVLEAEFGGAQDVEGAFVGDDLYVVQTRPQP